MVEPQTETVDPGAPDGIGDESAPGFLAGDRYEARGLLGRGGFATVYRAYDRELRREVALKVLRADRVSPAALQRFRREVAVARDAASDHLVRVFDIDRSGPSPFLTLELIEGGSLAERLARGPLPIEEAVRIAIQILDGLRALHTLKIVHRDVKPGNVLLTANGTVKLADFGLARHLEGEETWTTQPDSILGTLLYLSPEQALGRDVDVRSDLYSVGIVLFEMLAGRLPHEGRSGLGTLLGHLKENPVDVRDWRPETPSWLAAVVRKLLARRPEDRYPTTESVLIDLRARKVPRGRRLLVAMIVGTLMMAALGTALVIREKKTPEFSHFVGLSGSGVEAIGRDGRVLWTAPKAQLRTLVRARLRPGEDSQVVAILDPTSSPAVAHTLSILDSDNGDVLRQVQLPDNAAGFFPGFSNSFVPILDAVDLDGDGADELLITYTHIPWWPSYTVLYEPRIERTRLVLVASGHHRFARAQDLDGDGRPELLFVGINNRMGWYSGVAAVRPVPPVNDISSIHVATASSPDQSYSAASEESLLWYSLGPRQRWLDTLAPDPASRALTLRYIHGLSFVVGFDGFPAGPPTRLRPPQRQQARDESYRHLREAERLASADDPAAAVAEADGALQEAVRASDARLVDWIRRVRARLLVDAGSVQEGEASFEALRRSSEAASDIAYDAGKALHLAGYLERAISWYQAGLKQGGDGDEGRGKWEYLEGEVLALSELKRFDEALSEVDRFANIYPLPDNFRQFFRQYLHWAAGAPPAWTRVPLVQGDPDFMRYWDLEFRWADRESEKTLLPDVERELLRSSETLPQLLSLKSEILYRRGRFPEARRLALEAYETAKLQRKVLTGVRAHFSLIASRALRLARKIEDEPKAQEISRELKQWERQRKERP